MTIDLDELERELDGCDQIVARKWGEEGRDISGDLEQLIALARKGQELEAEVARLQRFDATASDYVESVEKRAEVYERALREIDNCGLCRAHSKTIAREALEKGAK